jgi:hypothetical protein
VDVELTTENTRGVFLQATFSVPRGKARRTSWGLQLHPSDHMRLRNNGQTPLFTRRCLGVIEAERDRRRHGL